METSNKNLIDPPSTFDIALAWIFEAEGGFVDDPSDPGGATQYGISLRLLTLKNLDINGDSQVDRDDILAVDMGMAFALYRDDYWDMCRCDELPALIAIAVFDAAVNTGVQSGIKTLQRACRVKADGLLGPRTLAAVHRYEPRELLICLLSRRAQYYHRIVKHNPVLKRFMKGWFNRLFKLHAYLLETHYVQNYS